MFGSAPTPPPPSLPDPLPSPASYASGAGSRPAGGGNRPKGQLASTLMTSPIDNAADTASVGRKSLLGQ